MGPDMRARFPFDVSRWKTHRWPILAAWLVFAVPASLEMPPAWRLLAFAILTGAVLIAVIYELNKKDAGRLSLIGSFAARQPSISRTVSRHGRKRSAAR
jgi:hypothetical protein